MKIAMSGTTSFPKITIRDLVKNYEDKVEHGVRGYDNRLNIRPAYQREFIYKEKQRNEVIKTVLKSFPLNTMYWTTNENNFELMDGQQRTISICQYVAGDFPVDINSSPMFFNNITADKQEQILNYELSIYVCEGSPSETLDWFKVINIAGEKLTEQELRNAIYTGPWLTEAKRWFSKMGGPAFHLSEKYVNGSPIRQELLEQALDWINEGKIEDYMSRHQNDADAQELWQYFQAVIGWVERIFPTHRKIMKGLNWGYFYNKYKDEKLNAADFERRIIELINDTEVDNKKGIYEYLLTNNTKTLNLRAFDEKIKTSIYQTQNGICQACNKYFAYDKMEADHIIPWSKGGQTTADNCQMLCMKDNRTKSGK